LFLNLFPGRVYIRTVNKWAALPHKEFLPIGSEGSLVRDQDPGNGTSRRKSSNTEYLNHIELEVKYYFTNAFTIQKKNNFSGECALMNYHFFTKAHEKLKEKKNILREYC